MRRLVLVCSVLLLLPLLRGFAQDPPVGSVDSPPQSSSAASTPGAVPVGDPAHGRYIVENVVMCIECHSPRDGVGRIIKGQEYTGGAIPFSPPWPSDWAIRAPRIRGLPGYTDELAIRVLTEGAIDRRGVQLRSPMPKFRMTPQDASDVVAYLKSLS